MVQLAKVNQVELAFFFDKDLQLNHLWLSCVWLYWQPWYVQAFFSRRHYRFLSSFLLNITFVIGFIRSSSLIELLLLQRCQATATWGVCIRWLYCRISPICWWHDWLCICWIPIIRSCITLAYISCVWLRRCHHSRGAAIICVRIHYWVLY